MGPSWVLQPRIRGPMCGVVIIGRISRFLRGGIFEKFSFFGNLDLEILSSSAQLCQQPTTRFELTLHESSITASVANALSRRVRREYAHT